MKQVSFFTLLFCLSFLTAGWTQGTQLLRQPSLSAEHIVFVYANDLWLVDRKGGDARRLTTDEGAESNPHFSPDGKTIAFTAQYDGNTDVYSIPTDGGSPKRHTWHPGGDYLQGWTPDGSAIVFRSGRAARPTLTNRLYQIKLNEAWPTPLEAPRAAFGEISPDGRKMAYTPITSWDAEWRNYRGGQAMPIWIIDRKTLKLTRTPQTDKERHLDPIWVGKDVYFLSERDYASNIWKFNSARGTVEQITFHKDFDIKSHDAYGSAIVYEQGGYLHILDTKTKESRQLEIYVRGDFDWARPRWEDVSAGRLTNASLSPSGKRALFEYRGEIFTVPKEKGSWRNLTQSSGVADRAPAWSPDGEKIAWFSDESGEYQLMIADQFGESPKAITLNKTFYFRPQWSTDSKHIAFTDTHYNLWVVNTETEEAKKVDTDRFAHPDRSMNPVWSPDGRWIAYARQMDNSFKVIKVYDTQTGESHQITDAMADAIDPVWDHSGKYLYFAASTDYGLQTGWLDMSSYDPSVTRSIYLVVLDKDLKDPFVLQSDEEAEAETEKEASRTDSVVINFDQIEQRILSMPVPSRNYVALWAGPAGKLFYGESVPNERGVTLHTFDLKEREAGVFMEGIGSGTISHDRKQLLYNSGSTWGIVSTSGKTAKVGDGRLSMDLRLKIHPQEEWQQIYREGWRYQRDFLYVDNVHGAPWDKVYEWYKPWVQHVRHRTDMNYIIDILGGEVAVGHSYTSGGDFPDIDNVSIGLLGADFRVENNRYRIDKIYTGESWNPELNAPLARPGMAVAAGDYLVGVDGEELNASENLFTAFEGKSGRQVRLHLNQTPSMEGARVVVVAPIRSDRGLRNYDWVESNRRKVDELSGGKLAYVYVPNTSGNGFNSFNRYYFAQQHKKGAIIDERNNGGGSAADYMIDIMNRKLMGYFNSKAGDKRPWTTPMAGIWGPKVMIINERAGSGGDLLPYMFRDQKIGPLVGTRTWGGLVGTWDTPPFIDGGRMVAPRGGFFDKNGEWAVEGEGIAPDIEVIQDPAELAKGKDPQLEKAVEEALRLLKTEEVELKPEPPAPVRWKRPSGN
ncbi:MAG TPA: PDZ domain-containing protein [Saprospiraceae bacterium]|nr:PDZ domain-containing protein [Saprospiraceae bacterium]